MPKSDFSGALPDGTWSTDENVYVDTWREFNRSLERAMPGWKALAFDPDVRMRRFNDEGAWKGSISIPIEAARRLVELYETGHAP
jgi:hypothetical protein